MWRTARAHVVEGEAGATPIATEAHLAELLEDAGFVLVFPLPDALDELFAAELVAIEIFFFFEAAFDNGLRGDAGMIGAWHPEGVVALHALEADDDVLQRVVEGVTKMEGAGDVRRRDDDGEGTFGRLLTRGSAKHPHLGPLPSREREMLVGRC